MLNRVSSGDKIFIRTSNGKFEAHTVFVNEKITESDFTGLERISNIAENAVILLTSEDELSDGGYTNRRIAAAKLLTD